MEHNKSSRLVFYHAQYNRGVLVGCLESLLLNDEARSKIYDLIEATSSEFWPQYGSHMSDRGNSSSWLELDQLRNYQPPPATTTTTTITTSALVSGQYIDTFGDARRAINLREMFKLMPSARGNFQLAALGDRWQSLLHLLYLMTAITSFLLNAVTVIVLRKCRRGELRKYLINLSVSDLLMSLSLPFTFIKFMHGSWHFPPFLCPISRFCLTLNVFVSAATITVIGINRHSAIMNPLKKKPNKIRHWRINKTHVILAIWVLGVAIASPIYLMYRADMFCYNNRLYYECHVLWSDSSWFLYVITVNVSTFLAPLALLCFFYTRIGLKLLHHKIPGDGNPRRDSTMHMQHTKTVKMLLMMVVAFVVTWLPIQTTPVVMYLITHSDSNLTEDPIIFYVISHWLSMAHSCFNPLIYCFMSRKFRKDVRSYICGLREPEKGDSLMNVGECRACSKSDACHQSMSMQSAKRLSFENSSGGGISSQHHGKQVNLITCYERKHEQVGYLVEQNYFQQAVTEPRLQKHHSSASILKSTTQSREMNWTVITMEVKSLAKSINKFQMGNCRAKSLTSMEHGVSFRFNDPISNV